jgi:hypothetical protein
MQGKRVEYVKGDKLVAYLCKKDYAAKDRPEVQTARNWGKGGGVDPRISLTFFVTMRAARF